MMIATNNAQSAQNETDQTMGGNNMGAAQVSQSQDISSILSNQQISQVANSPGPGRLMQINQD